MITIHWNPDAGKLLIQHGNKMPFVVKDVLTRLGSMGQSHMKKITPVDTANLRKRIGWIIPGKPQVHIGTNVSYAPIILGDTLPFWIEAKPGKVLAWVTRGHIRPATKYGWKRARELGIARYAKRVKHPGGVDALNKTNAYLDGQIPGVVASILNKYGITG